MNIRAEVIAVVSQVLGKQVADDTEMGSISEWDSIHHIMILSDIQRHFNIAIPDDDIFDLVSIKDIVAEVEKLRP